LLCTRPDLNRFHLALLPFFSPLSFSLPNPCYDYSSGSCKYSPISVLSSLPIGAEVPSYTTFTDTLKPFPLGRPIYDSHFFFPPLPPSCCCLPYDVSAEVLYDPLTFSILFNYFFPLSPFFEFPAKTINLRFLLHCCSSSQNPFCAFCVPGRCLACARIPPVFFLLVLTFTSTMINCLLAWIVQRTIPPRSLFHTVPVCLFGGSTVWQNRFFVPRTSLLTTTILSLLGISFGRIL